MKLLCLSPCLQESLPPTIRLSKMVSQKPQIMKPRANATKPSLPGFPAMDSPCLQLALGTAGCSTACWAAGLHSTKLCSLQLLSALTQAMLWFQWESPCP